MKLRVTAIALVVFNVFSATIAAEGAAKAKAPAAPKPPSQPPQGLPKPPGNGNSKGDSHAHDHSKGDSHSKERKSTTRKTSHTSPHTSTAASVMSTHSACPTCPPVCGSGGDGEGGGSSQPLTSCSRTQCLDLYFECAGWAKLGYCASTPSDTYFMEQNCPVSCNYCQETCEDYDCPEVCLNRTLAGDCESNPEYMLVRCKKTCQYCDRCANLNTGCPFLAADCTSTDPSTVVQIYFFCRPTCNLCTPVSNCSILDPTLGKCPRDWLYDPYGNRCIWPTPQVGQYPAIESTCEQNNGVLLSLHSDNETSVLTALPTPPASTGLELYFIGLYRASSQTWANAHWQDGSPVDYTKWAPGQPSGGALEIYGAIDLNGPPYPSGVAEGYWQDVNNRPQENYPGFCEQPVCQPATTAAPSSTTP